MKHGKVIVITSGKGGVGKTTSTAAIGAALAQRGFFVCLVDFDIGLRNLDLATGTESKITHDLVHVLKGVSKLSEALVSVGDCGSLYLLPASQTSDKTALTLDGIEQLLDELKQRFDFVLCDSPAGIEQGACHAMHFADEAIIVTNPEVSSIRDSDRIIGLLTAKTRNAIQGVNLPAHVLVTRYCQNRAARGDMLETDDIASILALPVLGVIPESPDVLKSSNRGVPITKTETSAANAYLQATARLLGEPKCSVTPVKRRTLWRRIFGSKAA